MTHAVLIEKEAVTTVEWEDGAIVISGDSPQSAKIQRRLEKERDWPVAEREQWLVMVQHDTEKRAPGSEFEMLTVAQAVAEELGMEIRIMED